MLPVVERYHAEAVLGLAAAVEWGGLRDVVDPCLAQAVNHQCVIGLVQHVPHRGLAYYQVVAIPVAEIVAVEQLTRFGIGNPERTRQELQVVVVHPLPKG
ncbi:hypothetical protein, partial [Tenuifilum osseticum]|uniref:hypothetical protein n=1 Tax=Tenuifilum osseticum TaxID=3374723 RepID=UPI0034E48B1D